ncbi:hypothetical protein Pcinc_029521 [Petrolisthes cinctipes]|uniref:Uncharacterized protein n=1 Tax=Petrolisthes cinctipes TaxID=88211 RepID=A0AAE1K7E3_PETCI|nr:hypothetical protein Pcinc_029521 [Petrolisthes cinctipes]
MGGVGCGVGVGGWRRIEGEGGELGGGWDGGGWVVVAERGEAGHELKEERQVICTEHELAAFSASPLTLPLLTPCLSSHPASPHTLPLLTPCLSSHPASPHTLPRLSLLLYLITTTMPHQCLMFPRCLSPHYFSPVLTTLLPFPHSSSSSSLLSLRTEQ